MKISLNWLQDFVTFTEKNPQEIARRITASTAEVDEVEVQGALLDGCVVGEITSLGKHPDADRLSVCDVKTDRGTAKVVCGGTNLHQGMKVAFAHVGTTVRGHEGETVTLQKVKIRGQDSEGMICAAEEIGLESLYPPKPDEGNRPVVDLSALSAVAGTLLREALGLNDVILHIDNHAITHRADLFSHIGFARECVAIGLADWKEPSKKKRVTFGKQPLPFAIRNEVPTLMPRYCSCLVQIKSLGTTPDWMKRRLEAVGWRSVSLPVDITNYVATELGMPLHSFDADDFVGDITIRTSKKDETILTLDHVERPLPEGAIVLNDQQGVFDLLGIMGGLRSSTKETTKHIYLHSAIVDPVTIRRTIVATGHRTDASTVYEKGIPRIRAKEGFMRALALMLELIPGAKIISSMEEAGDEGASPTIDLELARVTSVLGQEIPAETIKKNLTDLGCAVKGGKGKMLAVTPPPYRPDLKSPIDLIEEIGRIFGYDNIASQMPDASTVPPARDTRVNVLRDNLKEEGYWEVLPLSLTSATLLQHAGFDPQDAITVQNAISDETSLLQTSTLPSLLEHAQRNRLQAADVIRTFTVGHVFSKSIPEHAELSMMHCTLADEQSGSDRLKHEPLLLLKRDLHTALEAIGYVVHEQQTTTSPGFAHPGRAATLMVGQTPIGLLCEVHPDIRERFELPGRAAVVIIDLAALLALPPSSRLMRPLPQFPSVQYDVTTTKTKRDAVGSMVTKLRGSDPLLESVEVVDLYTGKPLTDDQYNLTLRFTYRAPDRTLTETEAQAVHAKLTQQLG